MQAGQTEPIESFRFHKPQWYFQITGLNKAVLLAGNEMFASVVPSSLMSPRWSSTLYWTGVALSATLLLYLLSNIFTWLRSFLYLRGRLPSSAAAKSVWNFLGDLSLANTSARHRWNTSATEALGPVFYIRALWMQV